MKHKLVIVSALMGIFSMLSVYGLGLSNIEVASKLNEPLDAKIRILSVPKGDLDNIKASLAPAEAFRRAGLDYPFVLSALKISIPSSLKNKANSSAVITIKTTPPLKEPFLNFLIEINWPSGRILREYTALLDPPLYENRLRAAQVAEPISVDIGDPPAYIEESRQTQKKQYRQRAFRTSSPSSRVSRIPLTGDEVSHRTSRNDTLWKIAERYRTSDTSTHTMMTNIYRANPRAFIGGNMNKLMAGATLKIPGTTASAMQQDSLLSKEAMVGEIPVVPESPRTNNQVAAQSEGLERLIIGAPETTATNEGDLSSAQTTTGASSSEYQVLSKKLDRVLEDYHSIKQENEDLRNELTQTRELVNTMKNLLEVQSQQLAALQEQLQQRQVAQSQPDSTTAVEEEMPEDVFEEIDETSETMVAKADVEEVAETPEETIDEWVDEETTIDETPEDSGILDDADITEETPETIAEADTITDDSDITEETLAENTAENTEFDSAAEDDARIDTQSSDKSFVDTALETTQHVTKVADNLVTQVPGGWITVGSGIGLLFLLIFVLLLLGRRYKKVKEEEEIQRAMEELEGEERATAGLSREYEERLAMLASMVAAGSYDVIGDDVINEQITIAVGESDFEQALDLGRTNLDQHPDNPYYHLRYLEILAHAGKQDEFEQQADVLQAKLVNESTVSEDVIENAFDEELIEEVDVYMAYERYSQAEDLIRDAITQYPDRYEYRLKLLEILAASKNIEAFEKEANILLDQVGEDSPAWEQAKMHWESLGTDRKLLTGLGVAGVAAAGVAAGMAATGFEDQEDIPVELENADLGGLESLTGSDDELGLAELAENATLDSLDDDLDSNSHIEDLGSLDTDLESSSDADLGLDEGLSLDSDDESLSLDDDLSLDTDSGDIDLGLDEGLSLDSDDESLSLDDDLSLDTDSGDIDLGLDEGLSLDSDDDTSLSLDDDLSLGTDNGDIDLGLDEGLSLDSDGESLSLDDDLSLGTDNGDIDLGLDEGLSLGSDGESLSLDDDLSLDTDSDDIDLGLDEGLSLDSDGESLSLDDDLSLDTDSGDTELSLDDDLSLDADSVDTELNLDDDLSLDADSVDTELSLDDDLSLDADSVDTELSLDDDLSLDADNIDAELSLDDDLSLDADNIDAELSLDDDLSLDTDSGDTELSLDDDLSLDTDSGDTELSLDDDLSLDADNIDTELSLDDDLSLDTDSGDTELSLDDDLSLDADNIDTELSLDDDLSLDADSGDAELSLDDDLSLDVGDDSGLSLEDDLSLADEDSNLNLDDDLSLDTDDMDLDALALGDIAEETNGLDLGANEDLDLDSMSDEGEVDLSSLGLDDDISSDLDMDSLLGDDDQEISLEGSGDDDLDSLLGELGNGDDLGELDLGTPDEIGSKFDLAQMYIDMEDNDSAKGILNEILAEGSDEQRSQAESLLSSL